MERQTTELISHDITCQEVVLWTSAYLDEHAGDERNLQIALHLALCAGCKTYVEQIASVRNLARLLPKAAEQLRDPARLWRAFSAKIRRSSDHR